MNEQIQQIAERLITGCTGDYAGRNGKGLQPHD